MRKLLALLAIPFIMFGMALPASASSHSSSNSGMHIVYAGTTPSPRGVTTWFHICTNADNTLCETANGAGNANTVIQSGYNKWQAFADPDGRIQWQNGSGNCMKATTGAGLNVTVINGACDDGASKLWVVGGNGNVTFYSRYTSGFMGINGHPSDGDAVVTGPGNSGFYYGWKTFSF